MGGNRPITEVPAEAEGPFVRDAGEGFKQPAGLGCF